MRRKLAIAVVLLAAASTIGWLKVRHPGPTDLVLTGVVTTNDVIVSSQVGGRVSRLLVSEGSTVAPNDVIATLEPGELQADRAFYARSAEAVAAQVEASRAELAAAVAQDSEARANFANAQRVFDRQQALVAAGGVTEQELDASRTALTVARARVDAAERQVANRQSALTANQQQQAAATAQTAKANVRLTYTEITAPSAGVVDVRAARAGEVVTAGQPIVTLVNPDSLWVRADIEETYIDRVRLGDTLTVRLPSGAERRGTVIYRGVDADFATQRDVSRTKRDIKTFEIRLRVDNGDRRLAVGMTSYVLVPVPRP
jgi:multidrug resistance efflux pump